FTITQSFAWLFTSTVLQGSNTLIGLQGVFGILVELPFFFASKQIVNLIGLRSSIFWAGVAMVVRLLGYSWLKVETQWWVLGVELLHGLAFSLMWTAAVQFANERAPVGMKNTAQGLVTGMFLGLGPGFGGIVGGFLVRTYGYHVTFRAGAGFMGVAIGLYGIIGVITWYRERQRGKQLPDEEVVGAEVEGGRV
ncbi:hypothetical protein HK097_005208, partial [Rhizophlyctis rosea]